jgi:hypothetical protein
MENNTALSIEHLPVELFHRIFDHLDTESILFSVRSVCRLFESVVKGYNRYKFDFKIISKCNFHRLCRLIPPEHLISLALYKNEEIPDQISFFISNYHLRQLTQLHSLSLFGITELQLGLILKRINLNCLTSFALYIEKYDDRRRKTTENYLSLIMAQPTLRKLELDINIDRLSTIQWPSNCRIESLIMNDYIIDDNLFQIIRCCPQLHRLILKDNPPISINRSIISQSSFVQLTSLTLEALGTSINDLESFLLFTPTLIHLKLLGEGSLYDGKRWEEFIQVNLTHLDKFEFIFIFRRLIAYTPEELQSIIQSFQSQFWIEDKKWFVTCQFHSNKPEEIQIFSIPICKSRYQYELNAIKHFTSISANLSIREDTNELIFPLRNLIKYDTLRGTNPSFPIVTKLWIDFAREIWIDLMTSLSPIINISELMQVELEIDYFGKDNKNVLFHIIRLLKQSSKLSSLIIHSLYSKYELYPFLNDLCSILPRQIKCLQIPINELEQIELILGRCPYLSIIKFEISRRKFSREVIQWFEKNTIHSMFTRQNGYDRIWIGKRINRINENPKRMKLMKNESKS